MLQAGVASFDITPDDLPQLQGHYTPDPAVGVLAPIEGRALVLDHGGRTVAVVTLDVLGVTRETTVRIRQGIEQYTSIPGDGVLIAASHTHSAPAILPLLGKTPDRGWVARVEDLAVAAVTEAHGQMTGATLRVGQDSADFNINRRPICGSTDMTCNFGGINDRRVRVLCVDRSDGTPMATAFHYACHPTAKSGSDGWISPDYPGYARQRIEAQRGGVGLFLPGCFGNIRPHLLTPEGGFASATAEQLENLGEQLAHAVGLAAERSAPIAADRVGSAVWPVRYGFGPLPDEATIEAWRAYSAKPRTMNLFPLIEHIATMQHDGQTPTVLESELQHLRLGGLSLFAIGGEPVLEIGMAIEKLFSPHECWATGYCNDMVGYLCTEQHKREGGYEPNAYPYFNQPAPFADEQAAILQTLEEGMAGLPSVA